MDRERQSNRAVAGLIDALFVAIYKYYLVEDSRCPFLKIC